MSGYYGTPDDLSDEMSDEVKRIADGVLPGNRERQAEAAVAAVTAMNDAIIKLSITLVDRFTPALLETQRVLAELARRIHESKYPPSRYRPDGRPRRTGHRHRGTRAWTLMFARTSHECWQRVMAAIRALRARWPDSCGGAGGIRTPEACALRFSSPTPPCVERGR
jgi:hypothetical protein